MDYRSLSLEEDGLANTQGGIFAPNSDSNRDRPKSPKTRMLCDIYKELAGSSDDVISSRKRKKPVSKESRLKKLERKEPGGSSNEDSKTGVFSSEYNYNSNSTTRATLNRNRRVVGQRTSKSDITKSVRSSKRLIRKTRTALAPSSLGDEENTSRTCEIFSNNTETATRAVQIRTRHASPPSDSDLMFAEVLLHLSNGEVQTDTLPMVATEEQAKLCELDGHVPTAIGSGLAQNKEADYGISVCVISRNPAEFAIEEAKKFMRRV